MSEERCICNDPGRSDQIRNWFNYGGEAPEECLYCQLLEEAELRLHPAFKDLEGMRKTIESIFPQEPKKEEILKPKFLRPRLHYAECLTDG